MPNRLLPMRPQSWLLLESVGGTGRLATIRFIQRTGTHGEMRLTVVVARAQCAGFLTQRHILSMKRGNDQKNALIARRAQASAAAYILNQISRTCRSYLSASGIKTVAPRLVFHGNHGGLLFTFRAVSTTYINQDSKSFYLRRGIYSRAQWIK